MSLFYFLARFERILIIFKELKLSNPEVGSSKTKIEGLDINYTPIITLFFCPPDIDFVCLPPTLEFFIS